ncbi:hypothetical protein GCM10027036_08360 [Flavihumibacter cheonanensis]|uniref:alkaline phosphatase family protein n=1 Tax=Flavihumibacter cheonanensis TaxID=1442385 RepID=UPI001EF885E2|nr:alkaline phosphatase family protein [Flavihumibacter cheonanensis]MCG7751724.1 alkaline phosphatase family protein [Flavihumibacter cheonanensis]
MIRSLFVILLLVQLTSFAQLTKPRVVLISIDGLPDYLLDHHLDHGLLPANGAFATIRKKGAYAETVLPVNIASTGPSHISIFTGASPAQTGIVGNSFRQLNQSWNAPSLSAFRHPIAAETIFQAAMRQGKKVMVLGGVGVDNSHVSRMTNYFLMYPIKTGASQSVNFLPSHPRQTVLLKVSSAYTIPLYCYLTDSAFNEANILRPGKQLLIDTDTNPTNGHVAALVADTWTTLQFQHQEKRYSTSLRFQLLDEDTQAYQLFINAPAEVVLYPQSFQEQVQSTCGCWPGEPENLKQTAGLISEATWFEQVDQLALYFKNCILAGMKAADWDLFFGYFSTLDDVQHRYTLRHPRQLDYSAENGKRVERYAAYVTKYLQLIDRYLLEIMQAVPAGTTIMIVSDHGMIPVHSTLLLSNYLEKEKFSVSRGELKVISSGNSAHIYLNKEMIPETQRKQYLERLHNLLKRLKDSVTGLSIFELVANQEEQKKYGLYHPTHSGELFVSCKSGYSISDRLLPEVPYLVNNSFDLSLVADQQLATRNFLEKGTMNETGRGVHGNLASLREGQSVFYALGPSVPSKKLKPISALQIAPTIARILGIEPPLQAKAKVIW